jgi:transcriptional regulator of NAD metabolism
MDLTIFSLAVGLPAVILGFIYLNNRNKREKEVEKLKYQKEVFELEIDRDNTHIKLLEEENKKLDYIINMNNKETD